jgi:hypothetical protein
MEEKRNKVPGSGRSAGTPNKAKKRLQECIGMLLEDKFDEFKSMMSLLKPSEYCRTYVDLLKYSIPAKQAVAVKDETEEGKRAAYDIIMRLRKGEIDRMPDNIMLPGNVENGEGEGAPESE